MRVSLIFPVYNVEAYIEDSIKSIVNQISRDFELVIVNDGSQDNSIEIAQKILSSSDVDYKIINRENGGLSAARNTGILGATGDYLAFIDSDDVICPDYVKTLLTDAESNGVDLSIGSFKFVDENTKFEFDKSVTTGSLVDKKTFLFKILRREIFNYFGSFLIKREYILKNNLWFDETVFFGVDQAYMWKLMVGVDKYTFNPKQVYNYFERPGSIMTATKIEKMLTGLPSLNRCAIELKNNPYFDSEYILTRWKVAALHTISKMYSFKDFVSYFKDFNLVAGECLRYPHWKIKMLFFPRIMGVRIFYNVLKFL